MRIVEAIRSEIMKRIDRISSQEEKDRVVDETVKSMFEKAQKSIQGSRNSGISWAITGKGKRMSINLSWGYREDSEGRFLEGNNLTFVRDREEPIGDTPYALYPALNKRLARSINPQNPKWEKDAEETITEFIKTGMCHWVGPVPL